MTKVDIIDIRKQKVGELEVDDRLLREEEKPHLVYETVRMQLAGRRRGTAATKERSLISGGGRKPWKQKGTGRARSGHSRSGAEAAQSSARTPGITITGRPKRSAKRPCAPFSRRNSGKKNSWF
jgi:large subunit ribosomal protein L4